MAATEAQTLNLVIQVGLLLMLGFAYGLFRQKKYLLHGQVMAAAWLVNLSSFFLVMVPSLMANVGTFTDPSTPQFDASSIIHIPVGLVALALSTFLVVRWALNSGNMRGCYGKGLMRATMLTWVLSTLIGIVIFVTMPS